MKKVKSRKLKQHKHLFFQKKGSKRQILLIAFFLIALGCGYSLGPRLIQNKTQPWEKVSSDEEIIHIKQNTDIKIQAQWLVKLMDRVGPVEAQEIFQHSGVPFTGQMHLLNHTVGDYIWNKYGPKGITKCKDYFSSSCFHGFIIRGIGNGKLENADAMMNECRKKGKAAYAQCAHAMGHGLLAYEGYANLLEALTLCDNMEKRVDGFVVSFCHNGVYMENIWGLHEGKPSPDRWIKADDIYYPCDDKRLPKQTISECWYNQSFQLTKVFKGDRVKVANECHMVEDSRSKAMCFDGLFRGFNNLTKNDVTKKYKICKDMPVDWQEKCIDIQASASYQQGDSVLPLKICAYSSDGNVKRSCYQMLYGMAKYYEYRPGRHEFCLKIPEVYRSSCPI